MKSKLFFKITDYQLIKVWLTGFSGMLIIPAPPLSVVPTMILCLFSSQLILTPEESNMKKMRITCRYGSFRALSVFTTVICFMAPLFSTAQEAEAFKPGGKPEVRIFSSLNTSFADGENHSQFDLTRAYFGYNYNFSKKLSGRIVYDVADPSVGKLKFTGMLKYAYLKFTSGKWTISGGMIPLPEYDHGDKKWGHRYIYRTAFDSYGFGSAADLGLSVACNIAPWIAADLTVMNGEGHKLTETDSTFKVAGAITLLPIKGLSLRGYFDKMSKGGVNQQTAEFIAAWENKGFLIAGAYNYRRNHSLTEGQDYHGLTFNGTIPVSEKVRLIGRYDYVWSEFVKNETEPWNLSKDGQLFLAGVEFSLAQGVNLSPNFQGWKPADPQLPFISKLSISIDLKF
jgi:hypothetical protein